MSEPKPSGFQISAESDFVLIRFEPGQLITPKLLIDALEELYALEAYRSQKQAGLWDFTGCRADIGYQGMLKVKDYINTHYDPSWTHQYTALVADQDVLYGLSRMYDSLTDQVPTHVNIFRTFEEAERWIKEQVL